MIERLEKFEAPPARHWLIAAPILALTMFACKVDYHSAVTDSKVQAEAAERAKALPALTYPLGCPEEDERGRPLRATLSVKGERHPRCYYGR